MESHTKTKKESTFEKVKHKLTGKKPEPEQEQVNPRSISMPLEAGGGHGNLDSHKRNVTSHEEPVKPSNNNNEFGNMGPHVPSSTIESKSEIAEKSPSALNQEKTPQPSVPDAVANLGNNETTTPQPSGVGAATKIQQDKLEEPSGLKSSEINTELPPMSEKREQALDLEEEEFGSYQKIDHENLLGESKNTGDSQYIPLSKSKTDDTDSNLFDNDTGNQTSPLGKSHNSGVESFQFGTGETGLGDNMGRTPEGIHHDAHTSSNSLESTGKETEFVLHPDSRLNNEDKDPKPSAQEENSHSIKSEPIPGSFPESGKRDFGVTDTSKASGFIPLKEFSKDDIRDDRISRESGSNRSLKSFELADDKKHEIAGLPAETPEKHKMDEVVDELEHTDPENVIHHNKSTSSISGLPQETPEKHQMDEVVEELHHTNLNDVIHHDEQTQGHVTGLPKETHEKHQMDEVVDEIEHNNPNEVIHHKEQASIMGLPQETEEKHKMDNVVEEIQHVDPKEVLEGSHQQSSVEKLNEPTSQSVSSSQIPKSESESHIKSVNVSAGSYFSGKHQDLTDQEREMPGLNVEEQRPRRLSEDKYDEQRFAPHTGLENQGSLDHSKAIASETFSSIGKGSSETAPLPAQLESNKGKPGLPDVSRISMVPQQESRK
eukprot:NODE_337_length_9297_cov_0.873994.p1 type:complete len:659 gc:universal NODE_337_length_9297_cov_0.873994:6890-8866(+)